MTGTLFVLLILVMVGYKVYNYKKKNPKKLYFTDPEILSQNVNLQPDL